MVSTNRLIDGYRVTGYVALGSSAWSFGPGRLLAFPTCRCQQVGGVRARQLA